MGHATIPSSRRKFLSTGPVKKRCSPEYALHYETGEAIPLELIEKMREAANHNQGFRTTEFIAASLLDLAWHRLSHDEALAITDARAFEKEVLEGYGLIEEIEPRYRSQYFAHIFSSPVGYSSGYYAYLWSEILDCGRVHRV